MNSNHLKDALGSVSEFHQAFDIPAAHGKAALLTPEESQLRYKLMREENEEYLEACSQGNVTEVCDALGDMLYIWCGTVLRHGLEEVIFDVFDEIHRSNMSKLGSDGKPVLREDGKVMKGPNYFRPNLEAVLQRWKQGLEKEQAAL